MGNGQTFGKYELVRKIADGGMASIFLASSVGPGGFKKPCVIKRIRHEYSASVSFRDMLVREAKVAALLNHPNIVQVFDFGEVEGEYFLTMEWVEGTPLHHLIEKESRARRRIPTGIAVSVAIEVARALQYLGRGLPVDGQHTPLVHRDVSPSNILISSSGAVKLTDFGIVKVLEAPTGTEAGVVKGKYAYMSPEQLQGMPLDPRSDIFSLGVVLFETITQRRLFRRGDIASTIAAVLGARVPPVSSLNETVPPQLDMILARALSKQRDARYPDATALIADLEEVMRSLPDAMHVTSRLAGMASTEATSAPSSPDDTIASTPLPHDDSALLGDVPLQPAQDQDAVAAMQDAFAAEDVDGDAALWWVAAALLVAMIASIGFWLLVLD